MGLGNEVAVICAVGFGQNGVVGARRVFGARIVFFGVAIPIGVEGFCGGWFGFGFEIGIGIVVSSALAVMLRMGSLRFRQTLRVHYYCYN